MERPSTLHQQNTQTNNLLQYFLFSNDNSLSFSILFAFTMDFWDEIFWCYVYFSEDHLLISIVRLPQLTGIEENNFKFGFIMYVFQETKLELDEFTLTLSSREECILLLYHVTFNLQFLLIWELVYEHDKMSQENIFFKKCLKKETRHFHALISFVLYIISLLDENYTHIYCRDFSGTLIYSYLLQ